jgi:hypothetical protein
MTSFRASALALALVTGAASLVQPTLGQAQVFIGVQVNLAPPALPVYVQPPLPGPDYIWTPGYWAWDPDYGDYYWVPGTWVMAPSPGYLWTPGYWGWADGVYVFHSGYWGPHIGYYGGVDYGFGYTGLGFQGGYWSGSHFFYNSAVSNVRSANITNIYTKTVIVNRTTTINVSYSGGPGGVVAAPTPEQLAAARETHIQPTAVQMQHVQAAQANRALYASANHGAPPVAATARPGQFTGPGVVHAARPQGAAAVGQNPGAEGGHADFNRQGDHSGPKAPASPKAPPFPGAGPAPPRPQTQTAPPKPRSEQRGPAPNAPGHPPAPRKPEPPHEERRPG